MNNELKPCPFCGGEAERSCIARRKVIPCSDVENDASLQTELSMQVYCTECDAKVSASAQDVDDLVNKAVDAWNTRANEANDDINDERRYVAARLREIDTSEWSCYGHEFDERMTAELMTACGCNFGQDWQDMELKDRLADLIEPEPERTCRYESTNRCTWACTSCGREVDVLHRGYNYCPNCGAKVIGG